MAEITASLFGDMLPDALKQQTTQGYTPEYFNQVQDYYQGYLPGQSLNSQQLKDWYGSTMAGGSTSSGIPYGGISFAPPVITPNQLAPLFQGLAAAGPTSSTGDSAPVELSPDQVAFFNFLESPEGQSFKDARGAALSNVIGAGLGLFGPGLIGPAVSAYNYFTDKPNISDAVKSLLAADQAGFQAARDALVNYGVTSTAMGPPTAAQMAALTPTLSGDSSSSYGTTGRGSATGIGVGSTSGINAMDAMSDAATASSNGGYSTATGIGVGSTEGINAMDAMSDAASSSSSPSSKIVCTAMNNAYGFGSFRNAIWLKYAQNNLTKEHEIGYHAIFLPLVDFAYKRGNGFANKAVRSVLENIARHRSADLRAEMRGSKRDKLGRFYRAILEPICFVVGKFK